MKVHRYANTPVNGSFPDCKRIERADNIVLETTIFRYRQRSFTSHIPQITAAGFFFNPVCPPRHSSASARLRLRSPPSRPAASLFMQMLCCSTEPRLRFTSGEARETLPGLRPLRMLTTRRTISSREQMLHSGAVRKVPKTQCHRYFFLIYVPR